jgi:hypothetical protein
MQTNKINDMKENYLHVKETVTLQASEDTVIIVCVTINEFTGETQETRLDIPSNIFLQDFTGKFLRTQAKQNYIKHIKSL